ncbi:hypothetical protein, partial [uncultured Mycobacterium sp.]|uniref:hypothetical protein n=1 Tax=uncultured Mycobacterium sp. TaxID=171292 RepID=UPI0035C9BCEC
AKPEKPHTSDQPHPRLTTSPHRSEGGLNEERGSLNDSMHPLPCCASSLAAAIDLNDRQVGSATVRTTYGFLHKATDLLAKNACNDDADHDQQN